jgi:hypothetical protein
MEKPHRMAQIYGYIICLVSVITFIICLANIIPAIMDLGDPLHSGSMYNMQNSPSLASFENYKMDILKSSDKEGSQNAQAYVPDDKTIQLMYEAAKSDRIQTAVHNAKRTITVSSIIILVSIALFLTHWIWMRQLAKKIVA